MQTQINKEITLKTVCICKKKKKGKKCLWKTWNFVKTIDIDLYFSVEEKYPL